MTQRSAFSVAVISPPSSVDRPPLCDEVVENRPQIQSSAVIDLCCSARRTPRKRKTVDGGRWTVNRSAKCAAEPRSVPDALMLHPQRFRRSGCFSLFYPTASPLGPSQYKNPPSVLRWPHVKVCQLLSLL